ncbi:hypothetical protein ES703_120039 [subsurface metagenome]
MATKRKRNVVTPDKLDNDALILALESQGNAISPIVATVIRLAAPLIARLAIRYVARKARKRISDTSINTASAWIGTKVQGIIDRAIKDSEKK